MLLDGALSRGLPAVPDTTGTVPGFSPGAIRAASHVVRRHDMLALHAETHEAGGQPSQNRKIDKAPQEPGRGSILPVPPRKRAINLF